MEQHFVAFIFACLCVCVCVCHRVSLLVSVANVLAALSFARVYICGKLFAAFIFACALQRFAAVRFACCVCMG